MSFKENNKDEIAIVTIGFNRLESTKRLFNSLLRADYSKYSNVPFVACVDCSGYEPLYDYVNQFEWPYGDKYVIIQKERQGLKKHIFKCGDLVEHFKAVAIFEDDTYVSRNFYNYLNETVNYYAEDDKIASIALYTNGMNGFCWLPSQLVYSDADVFLSKFVCSSGECFTKRMWQGFREWLSKNEELDWTPIDLPIQEKQWERAWTKFFDAYMVLNGKYSIYPNVSLSTNFGDAGEHSSLNETLVQETIQYGTKSYRLKPSDELVIYSTQGCTEINKVLGISEKDLCIDLYNCNGNELNRRYYLTVKRLKYKVLHSYGIQLRPIELNILDNIPGTDIFLYDTSEAGAKPKGNGINNMVVYHLHGFGYKYLLRGVWLRTKMLAAKAWNRYIKKLIKI